MIALATHLTLLRQFKLVLDIIEDFLSGEGLKFLRLVQLLSFHDFHDSHPSCPLGR